MIEFSIAYMERQRIATKEMQEINSRINNILVNAMMLGKQSKEQREKVIQVFKENWIDTVEDMGRLREELEAIDKAILKKYGLTVDTLGFYYDSVKRDPMPFEMAKKVIMGL
jgi:chaperonin GroEL (HSP60 family)